jgi:hypothetical protein
MTTLHPFEHRSPLVIGAAALALSVAACGNAGGSSGGSGSSSSSGSGSSSGESTAGVSLTVGSASSPATVGGLSPTTGGFFVVVDLTLKNTGATTPLSTNPVLFSLLTSQALVVSASPAQATGECSASVSVANGGQDACSVAFQVPSGQTATTLVYDDQRGDKATAPVPMIAMPSAACETYVGWLAHGASDACLACVGDNGGVPDGGTPPCASAVEVYEATCKSCGTTCTSSGVDPCTCELGCDSASCQALFDTYVSCVTSACAAMCP